MEKIKCLLKIFLANDDDGVGSIFGGNITPPISSSSTSRFSKIVIRLGAQGNPNNENGGGGGGNATGNFNNQSAVLKKSYVSEKI